MGSRQWIKNIETVVERNWNDYAIDLTAGGHVRVTLRRAGRQRMVFASATPGDRRALRNFESDLRRYARQLRELPA